MKQMPLFSRAGLALPSVEHGGQLRIGRRKIARPFSGRLPLHVVLQSTRARGSWERVLEAYARIGTANHLTARLQRGGRTMNLDIDVR
jgi:hypothetical protein